MTDVAVDTLRLRGPHARRLTAVAARALPAALDRAMTSVGDARVDRIEVHLDLDPADYDDQTLAVLWADAIRARVLATTPAARRPPAPPGSSPTGTTPRKEPPPAEVLATVRHWAAAIGRSPAPAPFPVLPAAVLALGDPVVARAVRTAAGPGEWALLLTVLGTALRTPDASTPPTDEKTHPAREIAPGAAGSPPLVAPDSLPRAATNRDERQAPEPGARAAVLRTLATLAELTAVPPGPADFPAGTRAEGIDLSATTGAAGLVLLYPWLADHCRQAEALHPDLDGLDVRAAALAAILDDPALADDCLVGLLAGRREPPARQQIRVELSAEVTASGTRVLASFAALLPGFGNSTAVYVRDSWIRRLGVVHRDRDPVLLVAATNPLDVVLPLLPYPLGLVKLPWSPPLSTRFAP